jgi:hypothetical protein
MKKLLTIDRCNECTFFNDAAWKCAFGNGFFLTFKDVDNVEIPKNCPLPDCEENIYKIMDIRNKKKIYKFSTASQVSSFLLGRMLHNYIIQKNGRIYSPSSPDVLVIQKELEKF